jgi:hypothetical protein
MRAQTTLDFTLGVSIFLLVLLTVFAFMPATLLPFTQSAQEETVGTNRVADLLVQDILVSPGEPYLLDPACTAALLSDSTGQGCAFDGATLKPRLDLPDRSNINITIHGNTAAGNELLCWDAADKRVVGESAGACDSEFRAGPNPPSASSTMTARRVVSIRGMTGSLEVRMW